MTIIKIRPDRKLESLIRNMTTIRDDMMNLNRPVFSTSRAGWTPEADMVETAEDITVVLNLAGVRKEDIDVTYHRNFLRVAGNRDRVVPAGTGARFHRMEIGNGEFERVFRIPVAVDADGIRAVYADGLLRIRMQKRSGERGVRVDVRS
jgi:HSP20 family protein